MNYNTIIDRQTSGAIRVSCGLFFVLFSFFLLYFIEGDVLCEAQYIYSHGVTTYSRFFGGLVLAFILQILQWLLQKAVCFHWTYYALSYFPSLLLLAMLSDMSEQAIHGNSFSYWLWLCPLLLTLFALVVFLLKRSRGFTSSTNFFELLWPNHLQLLILFLVCGSLAGGHDTCLYELKTERLILQGNYAAATDVAERALQSSPRLTQLRMYALSRQGQLGERLFDFPQYYRANGLLSLADTTASHRIGTLQICLALGALPDAHTVHSVRRYLELMNGTDSLRTSATEDYLLCYHLLQKDWRTFASTLAWLRPDTETAAPLPRAYQEAVLYINKEYHQQLTYTIHPDIQTRFEQYNQRKAEIAGLRERINLTRREFGNTFWWYYDYQTQTDN